jgi:hypothetical protein
MSNIQEKQGRVALKASISDIAQAADKMASDGTGDATKGSTTCANPTTLRALAKALDAKQVCEAGGAPCMTGDITSVTATGAWEFSQPSMVLQNNVSLGGVCYADDGIVLDYNGGKGPNTMGQDRIWLGLNVTNKPGYWGTGVGNLTPIDPMGGTVSQTYYKKLLKGY